MCDIYVENFISALVGHKRQFSWNYSQFKSQFPCSSVEETSCFTMSVNWTSSWNIINSYDSFLPETTKEWKTTMGMIKGKIAWPLLQLQTSVFWWGPDKSKGRTEVFWGSVWEELQLSLILFIKSMIFFLVDWFFSFDFQQMHAQFD